MAGVKCPKCLEEAMVIDARYSRQQNAYRRRKRCTACDHRFTTWESDAAPKAIRLARDGDAVMVLQIKEILKGNLVKQFKRAPKGANIV